MQVRHPYPVGTKVRVDGFPATAGSSVSFSYNGLVGEVRHAERVGFGLNNEPVYQYMVHFEDVEVPFASLNAETNKLERGVRKGSAQNFFEQDYLHLA